MTQCVACGTTVVWLLVTVRPQRAWPVLGCPPSHPGGETRYGTSSKGRIAPRCGGARRPSETYCDLGVPSSWGCRVPERGSTFFIFASSALSLNRSRRLVLWGKLGFIASRRPAKVQRVCRPHAALVIFFLPFFRIQLWVAIYLKGPSPLTPPIPVASGGRERDQSGRSRKTKQKDNFRRWITRLVRR